jgi:hypothetical protein
MLELLVVGFVGLVLLSVFGLLAAVASMLWWAVALPFKLLALAFKAVAAVLALPFLLLFAVLGLGLFGVGLLAFLLPALPLVLIAVLIWALFRRRERRSSATVV